MWLSGKESAYQFRSHRDTSLIPGSGISGGGNGNPLQDSCLENSMDREPGGQQGMGSQVVRQNMDWYSVRKMLFFYQWIDQFSTISIKIPRVFFFFWFVCLVGWFGERSRKRDRKWQANFKMFMEI